MTVYYRDQTITVCSSHIEVGDATHDLDRLHQVWHRTRRAGRPHPLAKMLAVALVGVTLAIAVVVTLLSLDFGRYRWHVLTAAVMLAAAAIAAAGFAIDPVLDRLDRGHEHGNGVHEVWARTDGREVLLLRTTDSLRFGRVYRALGRAIEQHVVGEERPTIGDGGPPRGSR